MRSFLAPGLCYRVGRRDHLVTLPPWSLGPFNGRWDDPEREYRVRYVGLSPFAAFVERISQYRPDLDLLTGMNCVTGLPTESVENFARLPQSWLSSNALLTTRVRLSEGCDLLDVATAEGMAEAYPAIQAASRAVSAGLTDYDASHLLSATGRAFTQALSRYAYDAGFAGIVYLSRFAPEEMCAALFEQRHEIVEPEIAPVDGSHPDFARALALHHLSAPPQRADGRCMSGVDGDEAQKARLLADASACIATRSFEDRLRTLRTLVSLARTIAQVAENRDHLVQDLKAKQDFLAALPPEHPERPAAGGAVAQSSDKLTRYLQAVHPPIRTAIGAVAIMTWKLEGLS